MECRLEVLGLLEVPRLECRLEVLGLLSLCKVDASELGDWWQTANGCKSVGREGTISVYVLRLQNMKSRRSLKSVRFFNDSGCLNQILCFALNKQTTLT